MANHDLPRLLAFADTLADAARTATLPHFRAAHTIESKGALFDPVTEADRDAEKAMRALIEREFPEHGIIGEEFGVKDSPGGYTWILDPVDGTRAFIAGLPLWGVLIGLYYEGQPLLGVMDQPYLDERYRGWNDDANITARGSTKPLRARACATLADAIFSTTDPNLFRDAEADGFARVRTQAKLVRYGYDCYAYSMVAGGYMDGVIESDLKIFDIAALIPILSGAGGGVCAWDGGDPSAGGRVLAYGDPRVRDAALALLR